MVSQFDPPWTPPSDLSRTLGRRGYALLDPSGVRQWADVTAEQVAALGRFWEDLPPDPHLRDGGRYRRRRHGSFIVSAGSVEAVAHRAHWQPLAYNALHGGMERWFEPLDPDMPAQAAWEPLLLALSREASILHGERRWFIESHPFRIDTTDGIGRPTPEGAHRDGVDLVAIFVIDRHAIKGAETRVFDASGPGGLRFTLPGSWSLLLLDDHRVVHESTPIQPRSADQLGWRDTLVITLRRDGFQDSPGA
jgi:hypothetical protein